MNSFQAGGHASRATVSDGDGDGTDGVGRSNRRSFLSSAALGAACLALPRAAWAKSGRGAPGQGRRAFKISLNQWSLHKEIAAGRLDAKDLAKVANGFGLDAVEYASRFHPGKAGDASYLAELKRRAVGEGVWSLLIRVDDEGPLAASNAQTRRRAVERHKPWVDAAAYLGCHSIAVRVDGDGSEDEQANQASEGVRQLSEFSATRGIDVLLENHSGFSAKGSWLAEVVMAVDHPYCGSLPDFDAFDLGGGRRYDRAQGLRDLMPSARGVSAKSYDFDAKGNEKRLNYPLMLKIVSDGAYRGYVGISYRGDRLSEHAGIERTRDLLSRTRSQLESRAARG